MSGRLPPLLLLPLATMSVLSFAAGIWLEARHLTFLQNHPYVVNLLSSITGFSTSALVVAVGISSFLDRERAGRWEAAMRTSLAAVAAEVEAIEDIGETALGGEIATRGAAPLLARRLDSRLVWLLAEMLRQDHMKNFVTPDTNRLSGHLLDLLDVALPGMLRAFDIDNPDVHQAAVELRHRMNLYTRADSRNPQSDQRLLADILIRLGVLIDRIAATDEYQRFAADQK